MPNACFISIGNELLNGKTLDTNSQWITQQLLELGISTAGGWAVSDDILSITAALSQASEKGNIIIITGGLGPTDDDLTRQALARYLGVELEFRQDLYDKITAFFSARNIKMPERNRIQAHIPQGAEAVNNPNGTAPGVWAKRGDHVYICLPGVPQEMKRMFLESVQNRLSAYVSDSYVKIGRIRCFGAGESAIAEKLGNRMDRSRNPRIDCTVCGGEITLHIVASGSSRQACEDIITQEKANLSLLLGQLVFSTEDVSLAEAVGSQLRKKKMTLSVAESCTGGLICKLLTDIAGSSDYLLAGWITYSNESKIREIGVSGELIQQFGAVSEPVAKEMAFGAKRKSGSDCAIAITGIAGPGGGSQQKPVGLVYIAVIVGDAVQTAELRLPPVEREAIRQRAALYAINMLRLGLGI